MRYHVLVTIDKKIEVFDKMQYKRRYEKAHIVCRYIIW